MKKVSVFAAIALITLLSACNGKNTPAAVVPPAKLAESAAKITIPENSAVKMELNLAGGKKVTVKEIEFMRGGSYIGKGLAPLPKAAIAPRDLIEYEEVYFSGTYEVENDTYKLDGDAKVDITVETQEAGGGEEQTNISYQEEGQSEATVIQDVEKEDIPEPETDIEKALCVSWKISQLELAIETPAVKHKFTGDDASSLPAIATYINGKVEDKYKLDISKLQDFVIKSVNIATSPEGNKLTVNFVKAGVQPVVGIWEWDKVAKDQKFKYELVTEVQGKMFDAHANGTIVFPNNNYNKAVIAVSVEANELKGNIIFTCDRID